MSGAGPPGSSPSSQVRSLRTSRARRRPTARAPIFRLTRAQCIGPKRSCQLFRNCFRLPGDRLAKLRSRGPVISSVEAALANLQRLYPNSIGEACFIDRSGPENARAVRGIVAGPADLSPDESRNPFFKPTFALGEGQVFQARPYISPDTHEWVVSNSTPLPGTGFPARAIVNSAIRPESSRSDAA